MRVFLCAATLLFLRSVTASAEIEDRFAPFYFDSGDPDSALLIGEIGSRTPLSFSRLTEEIPTIERLYLSSDGGDVYAAILVAREVDRLGLTTVIPEDTYCLSACAFIYLAGHEREAFGSLGVHQVASEDSNLAGAQVALSDISELLEDFNVPNDLFLTMLRTPPEGMHIFDPLTLSRLGLIGPRHPKDTSTDRGINDTEVVYRVGITRATVQVRELDPATGRFVEMAEFNPGEDAVPEEYTEVKAEADTQYRVALAEGVTSWQIVQELNQIDILEGEIPEVPAEGSLAPDSYEVTPGTSRAELLERMASAQERILAEAWANRQDGLPLESPEEALILASIIEKETGTPEERFLVSSVFNNRLEQGMRLQTDPTVIYGITQGEGVLGRGLRQSELGSETPWNTYVIDGLPPTPIANPGRASIEAALKPDDTGYIFFVPKTFDPADGHNFAETLAEHNENVAAYRALETQREK